MDAASEMLYPIMPIYLKTIGFSVLLIGILEGVVESVAGLSKGYFGKLSDYSHKRLPFVQVGYLLSALSKPMMAIFTFPFWIFFVRTLDRLGKGIRTGARDALLSDEATTETKGKVFGFHRAMDTVGAVIGPSFALLYLYYNPGNYITLFYIAFIPGLLAVFSSFLIKKSASRPHKVTNEQSHDKRPSFFSFLHYWKTAPPYYKKVVVGFLAFALFNSSDVFLLLKAKQAGLGDAMVIGVYIFYNLIYALSSLPLGILGDRIGLKKMFICGLAIFSVVYFGMSVATDIYLIAGLFFLYGIYAAATEGISKAWISNITSSTDTATAIGTYSGFQSICALGASSLAGFIWYQFGASVTFLITATISISIIFYFIFILKEEVPSPD